MSAVEFAGMTLGYWKKDIWGDEIWTEGCSPKGEVGIFVNRIYNVSDKKIRKIFFNCIPYDAAGEQVGKEVKCECLNISSVGDGRFDDPNEDGLSDDNIEEAGVWAGLWCAPTAQYVRITKVHVVYADGSTEDVDGKSVKFIDDKDSLYYKLLEEKEAAEEKSEAESRKAEKEQRKAEEARQKAEEARQKEEEETRKNGDRKARGIVAWAGTTDPNESFVEEVGHVTFYFKRGIVANAPIKMGTLIGWESTCAMDCLEAPVGCRHIEVDCVKDITTLVYPREEKVFINQLVNLKKSGIKKIVIPKEATYINAPLLRGWEGVIEFEDPIGWGIKKDILNDPNKLLQYIISKIEIKKSAFKAIMDKILKG